MLRSCQTLSNPRDSSRAESCRTPVARKRRAETTISDASSCHYHNLHNVSTAMLKLYTHFIVNYDPTVILVIVLGNLLERVDSLLAPSHQMNATTTGYMTRSSAVQAVAAFSTQQVQQTVLQEECGGSREKMPALRVMHSLLKVPRPRESRYSHQMRWVLYKKTQSTQQAERVH